MLIALGTDVKRGSEGQTHKRDENGENRRTDVLKNAIEGQVGRLRFRRRTQRNK